VIKCNICGSNLLESGMGGFWHYYRCPEGCDFEFPFYIKLVNWFEESLMLIILLFIALILSPLIVFGKIRQQYFRMVYQFNI